MTETSHKPKPFSGIRVLDFSTTIAGPQCTRILADLGAEVIKIEAPEGDMMRTRPPMRNGASVVFGQLNAGKKSVVLDLKQPEAQDQAKRLAAQADILVENYRPGVMQRFGLDYASLAAACPRLVYCSISGYGQTGPSAQLPAYAPVVHAASGYDLAHLSYQPGRKRPDNAGVFFADVGTGVQAFGAISAALYMRSVTGEGQHIDVSMLETMIGYTLNEIQWAQFGAPPTPASLFSPMACGDGYLMVAVANEKTWQAFAHACEHDGWVSDPRYAKYLDRRANWDVLWAEAERWAASRTVEQVQAAMDANGVPCSRYRTVADALKDPQLTHRNALAQVHDAGGMFEVLNPPFRFSGASIAAKPFAAKLGEHTAEVLGKLSGLK